MACNVFPNSTCAYSTFVGSESLINPNLQTRIVIMEKYKLYKYTHSSGGYNIFTSKTFRNVNELTNRGYSNFNNFAGLTSGGYSNFITNG